MASDDDTSAGLRLAACPFCHTDSSVSHTTLESAGEGWQCVRCGQRWDAQRLATVAAYTAWASAHDARAPVV
jgi:transcription elongation factor Elf1